MNSDSGASHLVPASVPDSTNLDLDALRRGDPEALGEAYRLYAGRILVMLRGILGDAMAAEDLLHDLFVGLPRAMESYEDRGLFEGWLRRIAARMALMALRTRKNRDRIFAWFRASTHVAPATEGLADRMLIEEHLARLPEELRVVIILRAIAGWSHREIGQALGLTESTASTRYSRAMKLMRRAMEGER